MGQLGRENIKRELNKGKLKIIPSLDICVKAASYDITPSIIAMSVKVGMLEKVYRESHYNEDRYYILVHPRDTVLIVSNEYLVLPSYIAGYVSSRVSKVVDGFGHISTTIDPNWKGAVLIALSNPSNQPLKIYVGRNKNKNSVQNQLATLTFHYLKSECTIQDIDSIHKGMRLDLLDSILYKNRKGFRAFVRRIFYIKRRRFTDYFMSVCNERYESIGENEWKKIIKEFSYIDFKGKTTEKKQKSKSTMASMRASDFIITENQLIKVFYFIQSRQETIKSIIQNILFLLLFVFVTVGIISEDDFQKIFSFLK